MFEFKEGETGLHKIENPVQVVILAFIVVAILIGISLGVGYLATKA